MGGGVVLATSLEVTDGELEQIASLAARACEWRGAWLVRAREVASASGVGPYALSVTIANRLCGNCGDLHLRDPRIDYHWSIQLLRDLIKARGLLGAAAFVANETIDRLDASGGVSGRPPADGPVFLRSEFVDYRLMSYGPVPEAAPELGAYPIVGRPG